MFYVFCAIAQIVLNNYLLFRNIAFTCSGPGRPSSGTAQLWQNVVKDVHNKANLQ